MSRSNRLCLSICLMVFAIQAAEKSVYADKSQKKSARRTEAARKVPAKEAPPVELAKGQYPEIDAFLDNLFSLAVKNWTDPHPEKQDPPTMVYSSLTFAQNGDVKLGMQDVGSQSEQRALTKMIESFSQLPLLPSGVNGPMAVAITCAGSEVTIECSFKDKNNQNLMRKFVSSK